MRQEINVDLPFNFQARDYQKPFFEAMKTKKRAILVWARRNGKDKTCWNFLVKEAAKKIGIYNYYAPSYKQGKKIIWENIDKDGFKVLNHIPKELIVGKPNDTELKVRLKNGSLIQIIGTDNPDALVGANPTGCVFTEFSLIKPSVWDLVRPILTENGGWAVFNGTPRGQNHFKEMYDMAVTNPSWFCQHLTADDTGFPSIEDIAAEREAGMSEDMIQQEFYCSWTLGVEGSYYAKYIQEARDEDRIGSVVWNKQKRVYTAWDIGYGDSCAIIFYQICGNEIHLIDYYENQGEGLPHYAEILFRKPYLYADHYAPHDIDSHAFSSGLSAREVGRDLGIKFIPLPTLKLRIEDGIEALRGLFPRIWIDETKCKQLIKCLENYRKEFDSDNKVYKSRPIHDWSSHGCFTADTKISVMGGQKDICNIEEGDLVLTPNGYKKVLKTFCYEVDYILEVMTSTSSFKCTPNHKIFSNLGLIHADALGYNTLLYSLEDIELCRQLFGFNSDRLGLGLRESFLLAMMKHKLSLTDINIDGTVTTTEEPPLQTIHTAHYNAPSGHSIKGKYRASGTCITKMETPKIMKLKILTLYLPRRIQSIIQVFLFEKKSLGYLFIRLWSLLKNGMGVKKVKDGTNNMQRTIHLESQNTFPCGVLNAKEISLERPTTKSFVAQDVRQKTDIYPGKTILGDNASYAAHSLALINMQLKERVIKTVPLHLPGTQKVYDFEVEDDHCYYANRILVSNSDAGRYLALAVKIYVDASKSGVSDAEANRLYELYHPVFK